ncbi:hypothetical protein MMC25_007627 [Agyrium rufum]|nr:hypothetical protein [Agyrium rufum]
MTGFNAADESFIRLDPTSNSKWDEEIRQYLSTFSSEIIFSNDPQAFFPKLAKKRRNALQDLVNRLYWQIRYGCQNPNCQTRSCLSYRKRTAATPYRRHTVLSARALATYLATQDDACRNLCPSKPVSLGGVYSMEGHSGQSTGARLQHSGAESKVEADPKAAFIPAVTFPTKETYQGPRKDPKSLTQNLFDTLAWRSFQYVRYDELSKEWMYQAQYKSTNDIGDLQEQLRARSIQPSHPHVVSNIIYKTPQEHPYTFTCRDRSASLEFLDPSNIQTLLFFLGLGVIEQSQQENALLRYFGRRNHSRPIQNNPGVVDFLHMERFALQSITSVLSSPKALLRSFRCNAKSTSSLDLLLTRLNHASNMHQWSKATCHGVSGNVRKSALVTCAEIESCFLLLSESELSFSRIFSSLTIMVGELLRNVSSKEEGSSMNLSCPAAEDCDTKGTSFHHQSCSNDGAHLLAVVFSALNGALLPFHIRPNFQPDIARLHASGDLLSGRINWHRGEIPPQKTALQDLHDVLMDEQAFELLLLAIRLFMEYKKKALQRAAKASTANKRKGHNQGRTTMFERCILEYLRLPSTGQDVKEPKFGEVAPGLDLLFWLRTAIMQTWDTQAEFPADSIAAGAFDLMSLIYDDHRQTCMKSKFGLEIFRFPFVVEQLDLTRIPSEWAGKPPSRGKAHLLSYPFLLTDSDLVSCFRAINFSIMGKAYEESMVTSKLLSNMSSIIHTPTISLTNRLKTSMTAFLVLDIRRDNILEDALNQLWRREKRELARPLRVRLGLDEGEMGVDHGGIQQEFFRLAIAEAFHPDYGMFTTDLITKISWFRPGTLEPGYKFELLGLLTGLAIYNGLTLPFAFPIALYKKLLEIPVTTLEDIRDGWPDLVKGLTELAEWPTDDVENIFMRTYEFSYPSITGAPVSVDISKEDSGASKACFRDQQQHNSHTGNADRNALLKGEPPMVTNTNRHAYITAYIRHLTDESIATQFDAFRRGLAILVPPKHLSLFSHSPQLLKYLIEGLPTSYLDVDLLRRDTNYEGGFHAGHRTIKDFWAVVSEYNAEQLGRLLEFVTASERIGMQGLTFVVQRNGGTGFDDAGSGEDAEGSGVQSREGRLPSSMTCFGRLLLPEYESREVLREKLGIALENARGFGVV